MAVLIGGVQVRHGTQVTVEPADVLTEGVPQWLRPTRSIATSHRSRLSSQFERLRDAARRGPCFQRAVLMDLAIIGRRDDASQTESLLTLRDVTREEHVRRRRRGFERTTEGAVASSTNSLPSIARL